MLMCSAKLNDSFLIKHIINISHHFRSCFVFIVTEKDVTFHETQLSYRPILISLLISHEVPAMIFTHAATCYKCHLSCNIIFPSHFVLHNLCAIFLKSRPKRWPCGFTAVLLWPCGFTAVLLWPCGFTAVLLWPCGFTAVLFCTVLQDSDDNPCRNKQPDKNIRVFHSS
jgi:hypothetical protein